MTVKVYRLDEHDHWVQPADVVEVANEQEACQLAEKTANAHKCRVDVVDNSCNITTCEPGGKATVNPDFYRAHPGWKKSS